MWAIKRPDGTFIVDTEPAAKENAWTIVELIEDASRVSLQAQGYTCVPVTVSEAGQEGASVQQRNELLNPVPKHRGLILGGQGALDAAMAPFKELDRLRAENARLSQDLEDERMRHVACGVVANANTPTSALTARNMLPKYRSASVMAVESAVDREMLLRLENAELSNRLKKALSPDCHGYLVDAPGEPLDMKFELACVRFAKERDALRAENQTLRNIAVTADEERDALRARVEGLEKALRTIIEWGPFPETGHHHPDGTPMSYGWCYGSNGERDYMRAIARAALAQAGEETPS